MEQIWWKFTDVPALKKKSIVYPEDGAKFQKIVLQV
jgi:hypothetical protein